MFLKSGYVVNFSPLCAKQMLKANREASWRQNFVPNKYDKSFSLFTAKRFTVSLITLQPQPFQLLLLPI